jgi:TetR/AcrR family transcriptional regulator, tetracycline repressor protein
MRRRRPDARPRPRLDLDLLVQAAVSLLDEEGLDALTTRRLAARLGVKSPALYWYVQDKNELLDLVAEAICTPALERYTALAADDELGWRERLEAVGRVYREVLRAHRDVPRLLVERPRLGPVRRRLADAIVGLVLRAGFPDAEAAEISVFLNDYLTSMVGAEIRLEARARLMAEPEFQESLAEASDEYPNLVRIAPHLAAVRPDALFASGLDLLLDGVQLRLDRVRFESSVGKPDSLKQTGPVEHPHSG